MIRLALAIWAILGAAIVLCGLWSVVYNRWVHPDRKPRVWFLRRPEKRERPIFLFVGRRGQGKTLAASDLAIDRMRQGEKVYANFGITDWQRGLRAGYVGSLLDVVDLEDCTVVIDEANLWVSARQWQLIPPEVLSRWAQSRHHGISLIFTSQSEDRVDLQLRQLVDWIVICERVPGLPRWVPIFRQRFTFMEEIAQVRRGAISRASYRWIPPRVYASYDTYEEIDPAMLTKIKQTKQALKAGVEPETIVSIRREPMRWDRRTKEWVAWERS